MRIRNARGAARGGYTARVSSAPDPHKPLRDDVRLLGELLGQAIRLREGERSFALVERAIE